MQKRRYHHTVGPIILAGMIAGIFVAPTLPHHAKSVSHLENISAIKPYSAALLTRENAPSIAGVLSREDITAYQIIRRLQREEKWNEANALISTLGHKDLVGFILAERYTSKHYPSTAQELKDWLANYNDHPLASAVYAIALRKVGRASIESPDHVSSLQGYGDSNGLAAKSYRPAMIDSSVWEGREEAKAQWQAIEQKITEHNIDQAAALLKNSSTSNLLSSQERSVLHWELAEHYFYNGKSAEAYESAGAATTNAGDSMPGTHWMAGMAAWRMGKVALAAEHFSSMAEGHHMSAWENAAASYWAYRAYTKLGQKQQAEKYLHQAAAAPRTFYGILALHALGQKIFSTADSLRLSDADLDALYAEPAVRRAVALVQIGEHDAAEKELRLYFPQSERAERKKLLALVQYLSLPALQISIASQLVKQGEHVEQALYPSPDWEPETGYGLDPALVFAFARQESGFRASALGSGGAFGVMQLMPATAKLMRKSLGNPSYLPVNGMLEPEANIALGQHYLQQLMKTSMVGDNLFYLIASYNAGPGKLNEWRNEARASNDPLLFLETIPFAQTRHYVKQVMANYWIYQELRGEKAASASALAKGGWPVYRNASDMVAER